MNALRSALVDVLRELPDAHIARIVRAAPPEILRGLVEVALVLEDEPAANELAPPPASAPPAPETTAEAARGQRPPRKGAGSGAQRLLDALKGGPRTTSQLAKALGISESGVRQAATRAGKSVRAVGGSSRGVESTWEATGR